MREHLYSAYITASRSGVLYTGVTSYLGHRLWQHKNGVLGGFTKKYFCHSLVYFEHYDYVQAAIGPEKQIKDFRRNKFEIRLAMS
jgi:putative endonuclease